MRRELWWLMRGTYFAIKRGDLFPPGSRVPPSPAPGGTSFRDLQAPAGARRGLREMQRLVLTTHRVSVDGLPRPFTLLQLTDLHLRRDNRRLEQLIKALADLTPDAVVLTGDLITKGWSEAPVRRLLSALPDAPRFAVMGNWEHWAGAEPGPWGAMLAEHGVELLMNRRVRLGPIDLAGTDDLLAGDFDPAAALTGAGDRPLIALSHSPAAFPELAALAPTSAPLLVLAGHSHGGQIRLGRLGSFFVPRGTGPYVGGWFGAGDRRLFVSQGLGWSLAPLRVGCPPEIAEIVLEPA